MVSWLGKNLCDAGFVINLKDRKDRFDRFSNNISMAGIEGVDPFEAIEIIDEPYHKCGCTQSHIEIAKKQIENSWDYVLYFEDDCVFDLFYNHTIDKSDIDYDRVVEKIIEGLNEHKPDILWLGTRPEDYAEPFSDVFVMPKKTIMSHCYLGSLNFAKFLVENLKYTNPDHFSHMWPIDFFISQIANPIDWKIKEFDKERVMSNHDLKVYLTSPMIFNQGSSFSNLTDNFASYENWVRGCYVRYVDPKKLNIKMFLKS